MKKSLIYRIVGENLKEAGISGAEQAIRLKRRLRYALGAWALVAVIGGLFVFLNR